MHSFCRSSQRSVSRCKLVVKIKCVVRGCRNLKRWARKRFPPSPCRGAPPYNPLPKNNECYIPLSGGLRGKPFAQHCSCPTVLRCSVGLTMAAFLGTIFVWEKWLPQSHRGQAPALNRQGGNVRVAAPYHVEFLFQNEYASYTGRSGRTSLCSRRSAGRGFFQLQKQTCQKLWPLSALEFEARLLLPSSSSKIKMSRTVRLRRTT